MNVSESKGGFYNPNTRNMIRRGEYSPSSEISVNRHESTIMSIARKRYISYFESLIYYFDEEWFDLKSDLYTGTKRQTSSKVKMLNQPKRCDKCKREWAIDTTGSYYLDGFKGIYMEKETCGECNDL